MILPKGLTFQVHLDSIGTIFPQGCKLKNG